MSVKPIVKTDRAATGKVRAALRRITKHRYLYLMLLPGAVFVLLFNYVPMYGAIISFKAYNPMLGIIDSSWVGLQHFQKLFSSSIFWRVLRNTVILSILNLAVGMPAPIILALLMNEVRSKGFRRVAQTITYLPHFMSWIVLSSMVISLLSPYTGILARLAALFGMTNDSFILVMPEYFRGVLVGSSLWKEVGWGSIIYLAAIAGVDAELYDAAIIDGCTRFQRVWHITLPGIMPTIVVMLILRLGGMLNSNFEQIQTLYSPTVYSMGDVISTYVYREGIQKLNYSYTTAIGLFQSVIGFTLVVLSNRFARRVDQSLW
ncbi:ABC transporter permease subunit [Ruminococcaceae bacterium OttesenSCG-928-L11]|nr:ABC transporter permease subunit [Ruminococcaceae bacterium OttesenSCG-928-L11]